MLQGLIQNLVSLIDNFMVAGLGDTKMSGVNVTNQIIFVLFVALMTLMSAGGMFMSQFNGAKDSEGMRQTFRFKIHTSSMLALLSVLLTLILPRQILGVLLNTNTEAEAIIKEGSAYLSIIVFTFFPIAWAMAIGSSLREIGKVRAPLVISVAATGVNTFFNWVLIYGNLGAPRLEVKGAAYATLIARLFELAVFIIYLQVTRPAFFVRLTELWKVNLKLFTTILGKSGFIFLSEMSWVLTETVMTAVYNGRGGSEIVSGMAAGWAIANVFFLVFHGIHVSTGVIVGGTLGKNELDLAQTQARWIRTGAIVAGGALAFVLAASIGLIPIVYGNLSDGARVVTRSMLIAIACYFPLWTYLNAQFATARSGGDAIMGMWVDGVVNLTMFLPGIFLLAAFTDLGPIAMYAIVKLTDVVKVAIAAWQLRKGRWVRNLAQEHAPGGA
jgi:putative MATE family efflux protein